MLDAVAHHSHALPDGRSAELTVSIGVAELGIGEPFTGVVERADAALYEAKRQGRNRVCQAPAMAAVAAGTAAIAGGAAPKSDVRGVPERSPGARVTRTRASLP
jgi:predicted signal transduction protein with EAL and GGDEF domain